MDYKSWLDEPCTESDIRYLDAAKTIAYLPIGIVERYLDNFRSWGTSNFKFSILKAAGKYLASGSVSLDVEYEQDGKEIKRSLQGADTILIGMNDDNMDYEGTILSFCTANAAKKLGRKFGRHLNGRLDIGETGIQPVQQKDALVQDEKMKAEYLEVEKKLKKFKYREPAQAYLETSGWQHFIPAKQLVNSKPVKK